MFDGSFRKPVDKAVKPIGNALRKTGLTPDHLTIVGLLVGMGAGVAIGSGRLWLGALLVVLAALPDLLDGALAKATDSSSQRGAFFDSTIDRITDFFLLGGIAWYFATGDFADELPMLPFAIAGVSSVVSYMRAKAESLGIDAKGGLMERAERIIAILIGLVINPLLIPILWLMLVLTTITAIQRFWKVWKQAAVAPVTQERIEMRRSRRASRRVGAHRAATHPRPASPSLMPAVHRRIHDQRLQAGRAGRPVDPGVLATGLATPFGAGANFFSPERREMIERHLRRVDPTLRGLRLRRASQQAFDFYARYWIESFRLPTMSKRAVDRGFTDDGYPQIVEALREGNGAILALPHLGGWEWAGRWIADQGHEITVVVEHLDPPELFDWFVDLRSKLGMHVVPLGPKAGASVLVGAA